MTLSPVAATIINFSLIDQQEYKESESPDGHCQPQLDLGDPNWNYQQQAYNTSENQVPQVFSTPNLPQLGPSSLNATSMGALQPYPPTMVCYLFSP